MPRPTTALIVDDELPARVYVRLLLRELVSGTAATGRQTRAAGRPENLPAMQGRQVDHGFGIVRHSWLLAWVGERGQRAGAGPGRSDIIL